MNHPSASAVEHYWRLLGDIQPDAFLFENVVAFESMGGGNSFLSLIEAMKELGSRPPLRSWRLRTFMFLNTGDDYSSEGLGESVILIFPMASS